MRAVPDVLVRPHTQRWLKILFELFPDRAVDTVRADQQHRIATNDVSSRNLGAKSHAHSQLKTAFLQNLQQVEAPDTGKDVAANRYLLIVMDHIDVVPTLECLSDAGMRCVIGLFQVRQGLARKNDAPAKRIARSIAF